MARKSGTLSPADFLAAAVAFVDEHGLNAMTMRALGEAMGVDATALYRHFPSKDSLIDAMVEWLMKEILANLPTDAPSPRERIIATTLAAREVFRAHPEIVGALMHSETGGGSAGRDFMVATIGTLRELGLVGVNLVRSYQMLEGFVIGACMQDFTRSPQNFAIRRVRYRSIDVPEFDEVARSEDAVAAVADEAFLRGVNALLDASVAA